MKNRIYKYELEIKYHQYVGMPKHAQILSAHEQDGKLCIWALVDIDRESRKKNIQVIGTGNPIEANVSPYDWDFVGTVLMSNGLVWHIFTDKL